MARILECWNCIASDFLYIISFEQSIPATLGKSCIRKQLGQWYPEASRRLLMTIKL